MSIHQIIKSFAFLRSLLDAALSKKALTSVKIKKHKVREYKKLGIGLLLGVFVMSLSGCGVDSPGEFHQNGVSTNYTQKIKSKFGSHHLQAASDSAWFDEPVEVTVSTGNFWDKLRGSFQLDHKCDNAKVKAQINWFIHHQGYLNRSVKRASPYMYYIFEQIQKRNLPGELLLLPFIESAFNPFAYSGPGAAGLWQIMPRTGSGFGLKQNWWYDGRRDVHASTNAALDYLTYLQSFFDGDWMLAIAAYNTGEGCVQQAVRRNARSDMSTDFFSLGLSQETQSYVPRLLALAAIISNPDDYPITLPAVRDEPYLAEVSIGYQIDLTEAAKLAEISTDEIHRLNPAYRHKLTGPRSPCKLLLPISHVETFKKNIANLSVVKQTSMQRYKVKRGESIERIASHFQISSQTLRRINHVKTRNVRPGKTLLIPVESPMITGNVKESNKTSETSESKATDQPATTAEEKTSSAENTEASDTENSEPKTTSIHTTQKIKHRVQKGETMPRIAAQYNVSAKDLQRWNHLGKNAKLKPGKVLIVMQKLDSSENEEPITVEEINRHRAKHAPKKPSSHHKPCAKPVRASKSNTQHTKHAISSKSGHAGKAKTAARKSNQQQHHKHH